MGRIAKTGWLLALAFGLGAAGCGKKSDTSTGPGPDTRVADLTAAGWKAFETNDLATAASKFNEAKKIDGTNPQVLLGVGWIALVTPPRTGASRDLVTAQGSLSLAVPALTDANDKAGARIGQAYAEFALGRTNDPNQTYRTIISLVSAALAAQPTFVFKHRSAVDATDAHYLWAQASFALGDFPAAAAQLDLVEPGRTHSPTSATALLADLTRLQTAI